MKKNLLFSVAMLSFLGVFTRCSSPQSTESAGALSSEIMVAADPNVIPNALPFTMEFVEQNYGSKVALPKLQSYGHAMNKSGEVLIVGGRRQGLHTFKSAPENNFVRDSANHFLYVIHPESGDQWSFDVNLLGPDLSAPLQSTNLQAYHDKTTDNMYVVGGYGWKADGSNMITFPTIIRFKLETIMAAIKSGEPAEKIKSFIELGKDDRFAVTGGELTMMNGNFYLVFGQRFDGQYRAFGGSDFTQEYTEEIRIFTLKPNSLDILSYGATKTSDPDRPFHRRDGNIIEDIDPKTGQPRITALGGVFLPGIIGGYDYPIYISGPQTPVVNKDAKQKFSQYECPVITIYKEDSPNPTVYNTMFGGISLFYYSQTPEQKIAFDTVTAQGRNDGFPFISDISTFQESSDGTYQEFIHPQPIVNNRLLGSSVTFIPNRELAENQVAFENGVIRLKNIPSGTRVLAGYIYGGIEAEQPLPLRPNFGTFVSNSVFAVYVTNTPSGGIPALKAIKADANTL